MSREVKFDFKLSDFLDKPIKFKSKNEKKEAMREVKDLLLSEILDSIGDGISPVTGHKFKKLSKRYIKRKEAEGGTVLPGGGSNLELDGGMLSGLKIIKKNENTLRLTVISSEQDKADWHNHFNGESNVPRRPFIPDERREEFFNPSIKQAIKELLSDYVE